MNSNLRQLKYQYFGHVARMNPQGYPYVALYGCGEWRQRKQGRLKKRWTDTVKESGKMHLQFYGPIKLAQHWEVRGELLILTWCCRAIKSSKAQIPLCQQIHEIPVDLPTTLLTSPVLSWTSPFPRRKQACCRLVTGIFKPS